MCRVCKAVKGMEAAEALNVIGAAMEKASKLERAHLVALSDSFTAEDEGPEEAPELAAEWERRYRSEDDG